MIRKSCTYKKIKTIVALSVTVGENWAGPTGRGSRPVPFKFRTTDYLSDTFWIFPLKKDWLVSIRLSPLFLVNLAKLVREVSRGKAKEFWDITWWKQTKMIGSDLYGHKGLLFIPCGIWADLGKIFYLPLSTEMRSICIHVMNDFGFLWCLCRACIFASRVTFFGGFSDFKLRG